MPVAWQQCDKAGIPGYSAEDWLRCNLPPAEYAREWEAERAAWLARCGYRRDRGKLVAA